MLPIVPIQNKKKKKTTHRPRFPPPAKRRCLPQSSIAPPSSAPEKQSAGQENHNGDGNGEDADRETPHCHAGAVRDGAMDDNRNDAQHDSTASCDAGMNLTPCVPHCANDDEQALLLAAEAAAALLDDPMACLEDVGESIDAATAILTAQGNNPVDAFRAAFNNSPHRKEDSPHDAHLDATRLKVPTLPPFHDSGPLGSLSDVKTFTSLPPDVGMSCVHSNFLNYYYGNEAVGVQHATPFGKEVASSDETLEENADGDETEEEHAMKAKSLQGATLKSFCSKYPRQKKEKQSDQDPKGQKKTVSFETDPEATKQEAVNDTSAPSASALLSDATTDTDAPQVEIIDGEIVVRHSSLMPDPQHRTPTSLIDEEFGTAIIEDESSSSLGIIQAKHDSYLTNPRTRPSRWSVDETKAFYRALRQCGTDLSMMQIFLPNRTRGQLKNKLKSESRKHPKLVDMALDPKSRVKLDLSVFGELVIPDEVPQICAGAGQPTGQTVTPSESPPLEGAKQEDAEEAANGATSQSKGSVSMEQYFDHLFDDAVDDTNEKDQENAIDSNNSLDPKNSDTAAPQDLLKKSEGSKEELERQPAILPLAPVARNAKVKKTRFKAKPMAKKGGIVKK
ncbi:hypothetical protein HJC23_002563 [Cyclotella cryptica]|uniref:Myb-like domain-containing protein n=1 Tax=Cyclotella cryptica TaxID=29204 RepID=A0ABD3QX58_9STRA|eukprot:CCRYP_001425-RA/>CCRYP_001425-RA protein AED:0.02 eAED:0.02 QI:234/1/1/1/1/1/2/417/619